MKALQKIKNLFVTSPSEKSLIEDLMRVKGYDYKYEDLKKESMIILGNTMKSYSVMVRGVKKVIIIF